MSGESTALEIASQQLMLAVRSAAALWADATTSAATARRDDLLRDKREVVTSFFARVRKRPAEVDTPDVKDWQAAMEERNLSRSTIYIRTCLLSSFYTWAMKNSPEGVHLAVNPILLARPKKPRAYQTESTKSFTDDELRRLLELVREKASEASNIVAKRDYALLQWYLQTGRRRAEVISLRGRDVQVKDDILIVRYKIKGGRYVARELRDAVVRVALLDYLSASGRLHALKTDAPLWTRHDRAGDTVKLR